MIKTIEYKECTCDVCGANENINKVKDRPVGWGWCRVCVDGYIVDYHTCADCGKKVKSAIESVRGGAEDGK